MYVFLATTWDGNPVESEEMMPVWFSVNGILMNTCGKMLPIGCRTSLQGNGYGRGSRLRMIMKALIKWR